MHIPNDQAIIIFNSDRWKEKKKGTSYDYLFANTAIYLIFKIEKR